MVKLIGLPVQPFSDIVMVMLAVTGEVVLLIAVKGGILPVPLAGRPMEGWSFVQLITELAMAALVKLVNITPVVVPPLHTV